MSRIRWSSNKRLLLKIHLKPPGHVFCAQKWQPLCRCFLTAELGVFVEWYNELPVEIRHIYEVVFEDCHCHLLFDVEHSTALNLQAKEQEIVRILKDLLVLSVTTQLN